LTGQLFSATTLGFLPNTGLAKCNPFYSQVINSRLEAGIQQVAAVTSATAITGLLPDGQEHDPVLEFILAQVGMEPRVA
jgi:hypothetical protein